MKHPIIPYFPLNAQVTYDEPGFLKWYAVVRGEIDKKKTQYGMTALKLAYTIKLTGFNVKVEEEIVNPWLARHQFIDIAVPEYWFAIEVWTEWRRSTKKNILKKSGLERDQGKEGYLRSLGWDVWWIHINSINTPRKLERVAGYAHYYLTNYKRFVPKNPKNPEGIL